MGGGVLWMLMFIVVIHVLELYKHWQIHIMYRYSKDEKKKKKSKVLRRPKIVFPERNHYCSVFPILYLIKLKKHYIRAERGKNSSVFEISSTQNLQGARSAPKTLPFFALENFFITSLKLYFTGAGLRKGIL